MRSQTRRYVKAELYFIMIHNVNVWRIPNRECEQSSSLCVWDMLDAASGFCASAVTAPVGKYGSQGMRSTGKDIRKLGKRTYCVIRRMSTVLRSNSS